jgi:hypothetical protein
MLNDEASRRVRAAALRLHRLADRLRDGDVGVPDQTADLTAAIVDRVAILEHFLLVGTLPETPKKHGPGIEYGRQIRCAGLSRPAEEFRRSLRVKGKRGTGES